MRDGRYLTSQSSPAIAAREKIMMRITRTFAARLLLALIPFWLAGCGGSTDTGQVTFTSAAATTVVDGRAWSIIDLGTLGGSNSTALALNNRGQVVGSSSLSTDDDYTSHPFLYSGGQMTDLGTLGGYSGSATAINDLGQVVGYSNASNNGGDHPFLFSGGQMKDLGTLGGYSGSANAINNAGEIVGESDLRGGVVGHAFAYRFGRMIDLGTTGGDQNSMASAIADNGTAVGISYNRNDTHVFVYRNGRMIALGPLFGFKTRVAGINNAEQIAGYGATNHAFLYSHGQVTDLGVLSGDYASYSTGINNHGQVVGVSSHYGIDGLNVGRAFLYDQGRMTDLNTLPAVQTAGWELQYANAINDAGQIAGSGIINGRSHAFLLSPRLQ